ncbi:hypothetical protein [Sinomicrobium weinanense]|uniref:Uncharacterized protein n=1 Tax=Sinomicrobium weinanense TaxID=2842200 RepID=A0A926JSA5_9FLAO|nr:hypothetical protein [Sinomicrobium weinanense]MBC9796444.1 hypothetical protein [Sinomicrobium weinanense]MBU3125882.1 hypothetical protein [Sinomicrobium weinanense]
MTEQEVRDKILEIFKSERSNSSADFDENHFMDFLTHPAHQKNTIKNSFRGVRKYHRFMDKLELEFGICFSLSDLDTYYSIDKLAKKVLERIKKGRGNKMILQRRNEEKEKYIFETALTIILVGLFYWEGIHWISILTTIVFGIMIYWILNSKIYNKRHIKKMNKRLMIDK